jgi:hypothetical protein
MSQPFHVSATCACDGVVGGRDRGDWGRPVESLLHLLVRGIEWKLFVCTAFVNILPIPMTMGRAVLNN